MHSFQWSLSVNWKIDIRNQINLLVTSISFLIDAFLKDPQKITKSFKWGGFKTYINIDIH